MSAGPGELYSTDSRTAPPSHTVCAAGYRGGRLLSRGALKRPADSFAAPSGADTGRLFDAGSGAYHVNCPACVITGSQLAGQPGGKREEGEKEAGAPDGAGGDI